MIVLFIIIAVAGVELIRQFIQGDLNADE